MEHVQEKDCYKKSDSPEQRWDRVIPAAEIRHEGCYRPEDTVLDEEQGESVLP